MAKKYTVLQFADRLEKLGKNLNKAILPPFRKNLKVMQRALFAEYWKSPFAARIWNWRQEKFSKKGGPSVKLGTRRTRRYARWSASESAYVAQINVSGLAAKLEHGGRLRRHVLWGRKGDIRTPGVPVPRMPIFDRLIEGKLWPRTVDDISKDFWKFVEREL